MANRSCLALALGLASALVAVSRPARAEVPVVTTVSRLPTSNGFGAVLLDLAERRLTHFREHLFAAEEPRLDGAGQEVWSNGSPELVATRDLLFDAYFGLRVGGSQAWLTGDPVDPAASGYLSHDTGLAEGRGGSGVVRMRQTRGALTLDQTVFMPRALARAGFVFLLTVRNGGASTATGVSVFSLHNFHLGFGRPGALGETGAEGETVTWDAGTGDLAERGFAGVVVGRPLGTVAHHAGSYGSAPGAENLFQLVDAGGSADLPDLSGEAPVHDDSVSGFQFDLGDLAPGAERTVGVVFAHHADPLAASTVQAALDAYVGGGDAQALLAGELASWQALQAGLTVPPGLDAGSGVAFRHAAVMLAMAQVAEDHAYLREWLRQDGEPRYTRFGTTLGGPPATLPATVAHRGRGAVVASLPPGEWSVAWSRDGAYAASAMAAAGLYPEARAALEFYLGAESGRFQGWSELAGYGLPKYLVSLTRYYGFGVEETDFNAFGPNLELDGFGLYLWALRNYERASGDTTLVDQAWSRIAAEVADPLVAVVDPATGLVRPDSSIWETHWNGRQRSYTYTDITAVRGLCDAAALAERVGDTARAASYRTAALALRTAVAERLTDADGALASNAEELAAGSGYWDAAVIEGVAMGLFDPAGRIAQATLGGLDAHLAAPAGAGWSRNDDRTDHGGAADLSPWGSEYDSAEWVITDLRGSVAFFLAGDAVRSDRLTNWVRDQALGNYLEFAETFDEGTGTYKFNAPMIGFGAGAYILAHAARALGPDPACGAYHDESGGGGGAGGQGGGGSGAAGPGPAAPDEESGCGCRVPGRHGDGSVALLAGGLALAWWLRRVGRRPRAGSRAAARPGPQPQLALRRGH
ncbi:MAG: glycosyl hydrolase [Polyangiaceae bacterium]|nr:glycosyl hydrolase [Polyangiaceae bacterium]